MEVLVTLTIVSIITITLVNFVNDIETRQKVTIARADINRIAVAAHLAEAELSRVTTVPGTSLGVLNLATSSRLAWSLGRRLLDLPPEDPWGNSFVRIESSGASRYVRLGSIPADSPVTAVPSPYIIDEGLGRVISAGPDGLIDTHIGQDPADSDNDLVVEFRHKPWVFYNVNGKLYVNSADGGANPASPDGIELDTGTNAQVSPDGLRYAAIRGSTMVIGTLAWAVDTEGASPTPRTSEILIPHAGRPKVLFYASGQWQSDTVQPSIDSNVFPLWLPDSSGVVWLSSAGDIYRFDFSRGDSEGPQRGAVLRLTSDSKAEVTGGSTGPRILSSKRRSALHMEPERGVFMAVSGDGKVAYRATDGHLWLVLGDGTAKRRLKQKPDGTKGFAPLGWIDDNNLLYWDQEKEQLFRIAQDGTIDIQLHDTVTKIQEVRGASLSTDGKYAFLIASTSEARIVKTDGTGFVLRKFSAGTADGDRKLDGPFPEAGSTAVWRRDLTCEGTIGFFVQSGASDKPVAWFDFSRDDRLENTSPILFVDPEDCRGDTAVDQSRQAPLLTGLSPSSFDVSGDGKMLAVLSSSDSTNRPSDGRGGVFIVPVTGTSKAMTKFGPAPPGSTYGYVAFLLQ